MRQLTADNDPINMGTYNYCPVTEDEAGHTLYDVNPYYEYGNTKDSPQKGFVKITAEQAKVAYLLNDIYSAYKVDKYRQKILDTGVVEQVK